MHHSLRAWIACAALAAPAGIVGCVAEVGPEEELEVGVESAALAVRISDTCGYQDLPVPQTDLPDRTGRVRSMVQDSVGYINNALDDLENIAYGGSRARYEYWFGPWDKTRFWKVYRVYEAMIPWTSSVMFTCDCRGMSPRVIAYATQGNPNKPIGLCHRALSYDFREFGVGSVIHELSHLANTADWFGSCPSSGTDWPDGYHNLAQGNPEVAIMDAELYRLYALDWHPGQRSTRTACGQY